MLVMWHPLTKVYCDEIISILGSSVPKNGDAQRSDLHRMVVQPASKVTCLGKLSDNIPHPETVLSHSNSHVKRPHCFLVPSCSLCKHVLFIFNENNPNRTKEKLFPYHCFRTMWRKDNRTGTAMFILWKPRMEGRSVFFTSPLNLKKPKTVM